VKKTSVVVEEGKENRSRGQKGTENAKSMADNSQRKKTSKEQKSNENAETEDYYGKVNRLVKKISNSRVVRVNRPKLC